MIKVNRLLHRPNIKLILVAIVTGGLAFALVFIAGHKHAPKSARFSSDCGQRTTCIALEKDQAQPNAVTVPVGGYVQFNSADGRQHNIGLGGGDEHHDGKHVHLGAYASGDFKADEGWKVQFNEMGTYDFHDHYHPDIHVTVVVYQPGGDYKIK
ncbi:MAG TPA: hypothetical protein VM124_01325 [Candidatus Limnocylindrales bacterium]|nr:hypothetical protein [Candidatus Limnocylindrales bacterium]